MTQHAHKMIRRAFCWLTKREFTNWRRRGEEQVAEDIWNVCITQQESKPSDWLQKDISKRKCKHFLRGRLLFVVTIHCL